MTKNFTWIILLIATILFGCQAETPEKNPTLARVYNIEADTTPIYHISFRRDITYGNSESVSFISQSGFETDQKNRVFITDMHEIKVFSENGDILAILGGKGRGPGEFESVSILEPKIGTEKLFVYDEVLRRINVYDIRSLIFIKTIYIEPQKWKIEPALERSIFRNFHVLDDSTLFVRFEDYLVNQNDEQPQASYYLMNLDGDIISEKIFSHISNTLYEGIGVSGPVRIRDDLPFPNASTRSIRLTVDDEWNIYSVWTEDFHIMVKNISSGISYEIAYSFNKSKLNPSDIISSYEHNQRMYQRARNEVFKDTWPAIDHLIVDDEDWIWIATINDDEDTFEWWVISNRGDIISKFSWPGKRLQRHRTPKQVLAIRNGYLYAREVSNETGQVKFVRFKISFEVITND